MGYLGIIRFVLAVSVAAFHILTPIFPDAGRHAVMGFFVISGFLITKIANETYAGRPIAFLTNRALRIYPMYWACLLLALAIAALFPLANTVPWAGIPLPTSGLQWLTNWVIFSLLTDQNPSISPRIIGQTWSLGLELQLYLVIGLATFRSTGLTLIGFAVSLGCALYGITHINIFFFYYSPIGVGFVFFAGSLAYFASRHIVLAQRYLWLGLVTYAISMFGLPLTMTAADYSSSGPHWFLLISVAASCLILLALPSVQPVERIKTVSRFLGDMAYPVFLLHIMAAIPFNAAFGANRAIGFFGGMALTLLISYFLVRAQRQFIDGQRDAIRAGVPVHISHPNPPVLRDKEAPDVVAFATQD